MKTFSNMLKNDLDQNFSIHNIRNLKSKETLRNEHLEELMKQTNKITLDATISLQKALKNLKDFYQR